MNPAVTTDFQEGQVLAASWYEDGMRHAGATVDKVHIKHSAKGDAYAPPTGTVKVTVYPAGKRSRSMTLQLDNHRLVGPRETEYELTVPTARDLDAIRERQGRESQMATQASERAKDRKVPEGFKRNVSNGLADLLKAWKLSAPLPIKAEWKGKAFTGAILADGSVEYGGTRHSSLSSAGAAAKATLGGSPKGGFATNGWEFWLYQQGKKWVPVSGLRKVQK